MVVRITFCIILAAWMPIRSMGQTSTEPATRTAAKGGDAWLDDALSFAGDPTVDRDQRVEVLRRAMKEHPDSDASIVLEFHIGTLIGQTDDPAHGHLADEKRALPVYEHIVERYDYRHFYKIVPSHWPDSPELLIPRAAILAASALTGRFNDGKKARNYLTIAMQDLKWTYDKRKHDWTSSPKPVRGQFNPDPEEYEQDLRRWENMREAARVEHVDMGPHTSDIMRAAVRQYGLSYGPQHPEQVAAVMNEVISLVPGTPMATMAQEHIDRAAAATNPAAPTGSALPPISSEKVLGKTGTVMSVSLKVTLGIGMAVICAVLYAIIRRRKHNQN